jgi:hypothetical protein
MNPPRRFMSAALGIFAVLAVAAPASAYDIRTIDQVYALDKAEDVRIELGAGTLRIEPSPDHKLRATVTVECRHMSSSCRRRAKRVELEGGYEDGAFLLKFEGLPRMNNHGLSVNAILQVPRDLDLAVDVGAGEVNVHDIEKNVRVDLGVGQVNVDMRDAHVGSVALDIGLGDARLHRMKEQIEGHGWLSKSLEWEDGTGRSRVRVHIGVGDADVALK